jgi:hypothetical protein
MCRSILGDKAGSIDDKMSSVRIADHPGRDPERPESFAHSGPIDGLDRYLGCFFLVTVLVDLVQLGS